MEKRQEQQKMAHDNARARRTFEKGEKVYARYFGTGSGPKWIPAEIQEVTGPVSVMVKLHDNCIVRRHIDHVRKRTDSEVVPQSKQATSEPEIKDEMPVVPTRSTPSLLITPDTAVEDTDESPDDPNESSPPARTPSQEVPPPSVGAGVSPPVANHGTPKAKTYPKRSRKQPAWYRDHNH